MRHKLSSPRILLIATILLGTVLVAPQIFSSNTLCAQAKPLYEAVIVGEEGVVRSGPGVTHYGTDRLPPGTKVQVYREDPGGWMAIQPPQGSFSLVQMSDLELAKGNIARIIQTDAVAWVGTRLTAVNKPMFQIRFRKGETVRVLGKVDRDEFNLTDEEPDWVQIAPPAGEFRWIAGKNLKASDNNTVASQVRNQPAEPASEREIERLGTDADNASDFDSGFESRIAPKATNNNSGDNSTRPFDDWDRNPSNTNSEQPDGDWSMEIEGNQSAGWKPARQPISKFVEQRSRFVSDTQIGNGDTDNGFNRTPSSVPSNSTQSTNLSARSNIFDASDSILAASSFASDSTRGSAPSLLMPSVNSPNFQNTNQHTSGAMAQKLAANLPAGHPIRTLELALSNEMAGKSPQQWNLQELAEQAQRLRNQASNPSEAQVLEHILQKINNCRQIKAGYKAAGDDSQDLQTARPGNRFSATGFGQGSTGNSNANGQTASTNTNNNVLLNYDASGFLAELIRDNGTSPSTFVLKDDRGRITHHVAAPPGLNLRRYLNQQVGIIGNRGYNQQLRLEHVTAERITTVRR